MGHANAPNLPLYTLFMTLPVRRKMRPAQLYEAAAKPANNAQKMQWTPRFLIGAHRRLNWTGTWDARMESFRWGIRSDAIRRQWYHPLVVIRVGAFSASPGRLVCKIVSNGTWRPRRSRQRDCRSFASERSANFSYAEGNEYSPRRE